MCLPFAKFVGLCFIQTKLSRNQLILLQPNLLVNGCFAVNTIAPLSFIILLYCSQSGSNGIIVSHLHAVVPTVNRIISYQYFCPVFISLLPGNRLILLYFSFFFTFYPFIHVVFCNFFTFFSQNRSICGKLPEIFICG